MRYVAAFLTGVLAFIHIFIISPLLSANQIMDTDDINNAIDLARLYTPNKKVVIVVDWRLRADKHRFFIVDIEKQSVIYSWYTSHGRRSGNLERAIKFSNKIGSNRSSMGLMLTQKTYYSRKFQAKSLRIVGLEPELNGNVLKRGVVLHPANYVSKEYMKTHQFPGMSEGCITLDPKRSDWVIDKVKDGVLIVNIF